MNTPDGSFQYIGVGGTQYVKAKGVWHPSTMNGKEDMLHTAEPLRDEMIEHITDVKLVRAETINGVAAHVYVYTMHADGLHSSATLWVDPSRRLAGFTT